MVALTELPVTRLTATLVPTQPWSPTPDLGVTLRGAVGAAVMDVACVRAHRACGRCEVSECLVPGWYDPGRAGRHDARPFALQVPDGGRELSPHRPLVVRWSLVGALPRPGLLVEAICRASGLGFGPARVPHRIARLVVEGEGGAVEHLRDGREVATWPRPAPLGALMSARDPARGLAVDLIRRTWLGELAGAPAPEAILLRAIDRVRSLGRTLGVRLADRWPDPAGVGGHWAELIGERHDRYSRRQDERVDLSGHVGTAVFGPEIAPFGDLLAAVEVLGVGRNTSAGMGWIRVREAETSET